MLPQVAGLKVRAKFDNVGVLFTIPLASAVMLYQTGLLVVKEQGLKAHDLLNDLCFKLQSMVRALGNDQNNGIKNICGKNRFLHRVVRLTLNVKIRNSVKSS